MRILGACGRGVLRVSFPVQYIKTLHVDPSGKSRYRLLKGSKSRIAAALRSPDTTVSVSLKKGNGYNRSQAKLDHVWGLGAAKKIGRINFFVFEGSRNSGLTLLCFCDRFPRMNRAQRLWYVYSPEPVRNLLAVALVWAIWLTLRGLCPVLHRLSYCCEKDEILQLKCCDICGKFL